MRKTLSSPETLDIEEIDEFVLLYWKPDYTGIMSLNRFKYYAKKFGSNFPLSHEKWRKVAFKDRLEAVTPNFLAQYKEGLQYEVDYQERLAKDPIETIKNNPNCIIADCTSDDGLCYDRFGEVIPHKINFTLLGKQYNLSKCLNAIEHHPKIQQCRFGKERTYDEYYEQDALYFKYCPTDLEFKTCIKKFEYIGFDVIKDISKKLKIEKYRIDQ